MTSLALTSQEPLSLRAHLPLQTSPILQELDSLPSIYRKIFSDLEKQKEALTSTELTYAASFIAGVAVLDSNKAKLAAIPDESSRNKTISQLTGLIAEPGLVIGKTHKEICKCIAFRVAELHNTYCHDSTEGNTQRFFQKAFIGPPCFNGRFITMEEYRCQFQLHITLEEFVEKTAQTFPDWTYPRLMPNLDSRAVIYEELIYEYLDQHPDEDQDSPPDIQVMIQFITQDEHHAEEYARHDQANFPKIYQRACSIFKGY